MTDEISRRALALGLGASALLPGAAWAQRDDTYSEPEIVDAAERFFGAGAEGVAAVVSHVFEDLGRPNGYIEGEEGSGAIGVGLRYGDGRLRLKGRSGVTRVYWQGPSLGFDTGGNASKVFTLVYGMRDPDQIFQRFPGVDGSAYFIGGVGVNYQRRDGVTLAPMRAGVGFRLGANIGYLAYSRRRRINPF
ncbi:MAG: hypothetical protein BroJett013_00690 [Alphaproteobacteria bacterium]|nr:MAG: hypothetical protein BroJett013_00690 [Alphaproteobacteria bacterium]